MTAIPTLVEVWEKTLLREIDALRAGAHTEWETAYATGAILTLRWLLGKASSPAERMLAYVPTLISNVGVNDETYH